MVMLAGQQGFSKKELTQISVCQFLISRNSYLSQKEICLSMKKYGFSTISQATVSRLLKHLGVVKIRNARGVKVYSLAQPQKDFYTASSLAEMVLSVEYNQQFILIRTLAACASYVNKELERQRFEEILGIVASNDMLWIAPVDTNNTAAVCQQIESFLKKQTQAL